MFARGLYTPPYKGSHTNHISTMKTVIVFKNRLNTCKKS